MTRHRKKFSERQVSVVLSGAEWTTILALITKRPLSEKGRETSREAKRKLGDQLIAHVEDKDEALIT